MVKTCECGKPVWAKGMCGNHYSIQWHKANPELRRAKKKRWEAKNQERVLAWGRDAYHRHSDDRRAKSRIRSDAWRRANPERHAVNSQRRRARVLNAPGNGVTFTEWQEIVSEYAGLCAYCGEAKQVTMDHIEPLHKGGAHDASNIAPACRTCKNKNQLTVWLAKRAA